MAIQNTIPPIPQTPSQVVPSPGDMVTPPVSAQAPAKPKKKIPKLLMIILGIFAVVILIFLVIKLVLPRFTKEKEISLVWWGLWENDAEVTALISEYELQNPGVIITYKRQSKEDYRERLTSSLAKNEGPDIFRFHNTWVPMFASELDTLSSEVLTASEYSQDYYSIAQSDLSGPNGVVGIPLEYDALTLFINKDIFDANGKTPPTTWDELRTISKELTVKDEAGIITQAGVALGRTENVDHWPEILSLMMIQNGVNMNNPSGPLAENALSYFTLYSKGESVWNETLPPSTVAFSAGKLAMYFGPSWRAFEIIDQNPGLNFQTVPLPQLAQEEGARTSVSLATYWAEGVWARSEQKEKAWNFLKFVSTSESLEALFQASAKTRRFGEPYSRPDMAALLVDHPILGSIIKLAPDAHSSYLVSRTFDGPTGINSQMTSYFEDAVNAVNDRTSPEDALETVSAGVAQVLAQYRLLGQ